MDKNKWVVLSVKVEKEIADKLKERVKRDKLEKGSTYNQSCVVARNLVLVWKCGIRNLSKSLSKNIVCRYGEKKKT